MKLIELLKIELPKRGGWPEGATIAWQSEIDGEIYFCGDEGSRVKYSKLWLGWSSDRGFDAGVTREQYEAEISKPSQLDAFNLISTGKSSRCLEHFIRAGWTESQLIEAGYFRVVKPVEELPDQAVTVRIKIVENTKKHYTTTKCSEGEMIALTGKKHTAHSFLEKGVQHMKDRAAQRDSEDGERSMKACVDAFNAMFGHSLTETQGWQFMVLLKMARSRNEFNPDDYEDGAAYTGLAGEAHSNEKK